MSYSVRLGCDDSVVASPIEHRAFGHSPVHLQPCDRLAERLRRDGLFAIFRLGLTLQSRAPGELEHF